MLLPVELLVEDHDLRTTVGHYDLGLYAVHLADVVRGNDILGGAYGEYRPILQHYYVVGVPGSGIQVMTDHDDEHVLLPRQTVKEPGDLHLMPDVQVGGRLVQEQYLRFLNYPPRQHDLLMLSGGEFVERPHRQIPYAEQIEGPIDLIEVLIQGLP